MLITITNNSSVNGRPSSIGQNTISLGYSQEYEFDIDDFTVNTSPAYSDPEGDPVSYIKILSLPTTGSLKISGNFVSLNDRVAVGDITSGNFVYFSDDTVTTSYVVAFDFDIADTGSETVSGLFTGKMNISMIEKENEPPSAVGDNTVSVDHGEAYVFTRNDFTSNTTPAYSDPEGDQPYQLKILSLPASGVLTFNGLNASVNQIIDISQLDSGYLQYSPDNSNTSLHDISFRFAVSDGGSETFIEN